MAMTVKRKKEDSVKKVIQHRIADIRGGIGIKVSELGGSYLYEGTPLGAPVNGLASVVKVAKIVTNAAADAVEYEVGKGHHFKVGDAVFAQENGTASTITAINISNTSKDIITVDATLGVAVTIGDSLMHAAEAGGAAVLSVVPQSINGTNQPVIAQENIFTDAWLIAVTKDTLPATIVDQMKGIVQI